MNIPFNTHLVYITLNDDKFYQLNSDFSKEEVDQEEVLTKLRMFDDSKQNVMVLHKAQFEHGKQYLLDKENPAGISIQAAEQYYKMDFITKSELYDYIY